MSNKISISDFVSSSSLVSRESARQLVKLISKSPDCDVVLDFSDILYSSRSFFSEWNSLQPKLKLLGKQIDIINLNENLSKLNQLVINTSLKKNRLDFPSLTSAQSISL